jgi:ABC-type sugar transport system ATPase subunit
MRIALRIEFKALHQKSGQTIVYVTHDQVEAMSLSDRIAVLNGGRFEQIGTPDEIYRRPATRFVATFVGTPPMNILEVELEERAGQRLGKAAQIEVPLPPEVRLPHGLRRLGLGVRPEAIAVAPVRTETTPFPGEVFWLHSRCPDRRPGSEGGRAGIPSGRASGLGLVRVRSAGRPPSESGDRQLLSLRPAAL